jgi:hypothetical protein
VQLDTHCLTDKSGLIQFGVIDESVYNNPGASSMFEVDFSNRPINDPDKDRGSIQTFIQVEGQRYDETEYATPHTVFMDAQGSELLALKGFGTLLRNVQNIVLETSMISTYIGGSTYSEISIYLNTFGLNYVISDLFGTKEPKHSNQATWQGEFNVVFGR